MSIEAVVSRVLLDRNGAGYLELEPIVDANGISSGPGQGRFSFLQYPVPVGWLALESCDLEGHVVWGSDSNLMLGEREIAKRLGYNKLEFCGTDKFICSIERELQRRRERQPSGLCPPLPSSPQVWQPSRYLPYKGTLSYDKAYWAIGSEFCFIQGLGLQRSCEHLQITCNRIVGKVESLTPYLQHESLRPEGKGRTLFLCLQDRWFSFPKCYLQSPPGLSVASGDMAIIESLCFGRFARE